MRKKQTKNKNIFEYNNIKSYFTKNTNYQGLNNTKVTVREYRI